MAIEEDDRQSTRKRKAIVGAATTTFLHKGYLGTSMDEIAALAGVSKQTVYKHFADKERCATPATWPPTCATWRAASSRS